MVTPTPALSFYSCLSTTTIILYINISNLYYVGIAVICGGYFIVDQKFKPVTTKERLNSCWNLNFDAYKFCAP